MKIKYTKHIIYDKIPFFKKKSIVITKNQIEETIKNPDHLDEESDKPNLIASKEFDKTRVLRVVYKIENDIIKAITIYPAEKGRYY